MAVPGARETVPAIRHGDWLACSHCGTKFARGVCALEETDARVKCYRCGAWVALTPALTREHNSS